jgi:hypothetical protein
MSFQEAIMARTANPNRISKVDITNDTLTGRGGMSLFGRHLISVGILSLLGDSFGRIRKSAKGLAICKLFQQVFCFLFDGTSRHLQYFDELSQDKGYAAVIETDPKDMASSHTVKRFFGAFGIWCLPVFRKILIILFAWRLRIEKPREVRLTLDTMVMDNDEAQKRHGVEPTYKKKKGFQPLQMLWNRKIVDAVFRGGKKHGNHGETAVHMLRRVVSVIRNACGQTVFIVVRLDSGFFDEQILKALDELNVAFIVSGKMYQSIKEYVSTRSREDWGVYVNDQQCWEFTEFGWRCDSWKQFYRTFYTRPVYEQGQGLLEFARPDNVILTNLGVNPALLKACSEQQQAYWLAPETIINCHHERGADELPHRGLKDFGFEQLPFKRFHANCAFYYCMVIAFFLFETFKEDVLSEVIPVTSYATTVRRKVVDIAAKIAKTSHGITLKVTRVVMEAFKFTKLWDLSNAAPAIPPALLC